MSRMLKDNEWYERVSPGSIYETDYERLVLNYGSLIFPEFHCLPFKLNVESEYETAIADFALIHQKYIEWWVGEIEIGTHPLSHVYRQVRALSEAAYGEEVAEYLYNKDPHLDYTKLKDLMKGHQPRVIVIVNESKEEWVQKLERFAALVTVFEIYRSSRNSYIFRVNGCQPETSSCDLCVCRSDPLLPRFLLVESPAVLPFASGQQICLRYKDSLTLWERIDSKDKVWLTPVGANPLSIKATYIIKQKSDGSFEIYENPS